MKVEWPDKRGSDKALVKDDHDIEIMQECKDTSARGEMSFLKFEP